MAARSVRISGACALGAPYRWLAARLKPRADGNLVRDGLVYSRRALLGLAPWKAGRHRVVVFIGLLLVLGDLGIVAGLVLAVVVAALLRRSQLARPGVSASGRWVALIAAFTTLGLVVAGNAWILISSYEEGRPAMSQAAGAWTDGDGATLRILPDGTFTATHLPSDTDSSTSRDVTVQALPADEHGTWQMTRGDSTWYLLCSLSGGQRCPWAGMGRSEHPPKSGRVHIRWCRPWVSYLRAPGPLLSR
jgi:hypothetical protein